MDNPTSVTRIVGRMRFFDAIREVAPQVVEDLDQRAFGHVHALYDKLPDSSEDRPSRATNRPVLERSELRRWSLVGTATEGRFPEAVPLRSAIEEWGANWNLSDEWCFGIALHTLVRWVKSEPHREARVWFFPGSVGSMPRAWFTFETKGYQAIWDDWGETKKRMTSEFQRALGEHKRAQELAVREAEDRTIEEKRHSEHFEWLVRFQALGEPPDAIVRWIGQKRAGRPPTSQSVLEGLRTAADLIGLSLRQGRQGPRGRRNTG